MPTTSPDRGYTIPVLTDAADAPAAFLDFASDVEDDIGEVEDSLADVVPQGLLDWVSFASAEDGSATSGGFSTITGLTLASVTVPGSGTRKIRVALSSRVSITGSGTVTVTGRFKHGSTIIGSCVSDKLATNSNGPLVGFGIVELSPGSYTFTVELGPDSAVTSRMRGDLNPALFTVEDLGPA